ncbi:protein LURP-one-related 11-like [Hordeum vulgare]|nr:protein LURP-one-related 11-like [Hordeum vulgare]
MARVHSSPSFSSSSSPAGDGRGKVFTLWLKSLVLNGRGCTVYDSDGHIVYRVDNYGSKCSDNVCLMDLRGNVVVNIHKKVRAFFSFSVVKNKNVRTIKLRIPSRSVKMFCILGQTREKLAFGKWEGYKWTGRTQEASAWFKVARPRGGIFHRSGRRPSSSPCEFESDAGRAMRYRIDDDGGARAGKRACCRIVDAGTGLVVAEVKRKVTAGGVALGEDVLALVVEPGVDDSLIMGLVLVYGLMNRTM